MANERRATNHLPETRQDALPLFGRDDVEELHGDDATHAASPFDDGAIDRGIAAFANALADRELATVLELETRFRRFAGRRRKRCEPAHLFVPRKRRKTSEGDSCNDRTAPSPRSREPRSAEIGGRKEAFWIS